MAAAAAGRRSSQHGIYIPSLPGRLTEDADDGDGDMDEDEDVLNEEVESVVSDEPAAAAATARFDSESEQDELSGGASRRTGDENGEDGEDEDDDEGVVHDDDESGDEFDAEVAAATAASSRRMLHGSGGPDRGSPSHHPMFLQRVVSPSRGLQGEDTGRSMRRRSSSRSLASNQRSFMVRLSQGGSAWKDQIISTRAPSRQGSTASLHRSMSRSHAASTQQLRPAGVKPLNLTNARLDAAAPTAERPQTARQSSSPGHARPGSSLQRPQTARQRPQSARLPTTSPGSAAGAAAAAGRGSAVTPRRPMTARGRASGATPRTRQPVRPASAMPGASRKTRFSKQAQQQQQQQQLQQQQLQHAGRNNEAAAPADPTHAPAAGPNGPGRGVAKKSRNGKRDGYQFASLQEEADRRMYPGLEIVHNVKHCDIDVPNCPFCTHRRIRRQRKAHAETRIAAATPRTRRKSLAGKQAAAAAAAAAATTPAMATGSGVGEEHDGDISDASALISPEQRLKMLQRQIKKATKAGDLDQLIQLRTQALALTMLSQQGERSADLVYSHYNLAYAYFQRDWIPQALEHALIARNVNHSVKEESREAKRFHAKIMLILGVCYTRLGMLTEAGYSLSTARKIKCKYGEQHDLSMAPLYMATGKLYASEHRHTLAEEFLLKAWEVLEKHHGAVHVDIAKTFWELAKVQTASPAAEKRRAETVDLLKQALTMYQDLKGMCREAAEISIALALLYAQLGQHEDAIQACQLTADIFDQLLGPGNKTTQAAWRKVTQLLIQFRSYDKATILLQRLLEQEKQQHGEVSMAVAETSRTLASVLLTSDDWHGALQHFRHAHRVCRRLLGPKHKRSIDLHDTIANLVAQHPGA